MAVSPLSGQQETHAAAWELDSALWNPKGHRTSFMNVWIAPVAHTHPEAEGISRGNVEQSARKDVVVGW